MNTSKISQFLILIAMLLVGTLMSEVTIAADGGRSGHGFSGGGHAGGGGRHAGGGGRYVGGGGRYVGGRGRYVGGRGRYVGGRGRYVGGRYSGGWNRGARVGIYLGAPIGFSYGYNPYSYYGAPYYGNPYYGVPYSPTYYPLAQPAPVTYVERSDEQQIDTQVELSDEQEIDTQAAQNDSSQNAQGSWWYYCVDAKAYYPYVNQCPGGWLRVAPQPATDSDDQPALNDSPAP